MVVVGAVVDGAQSGSWSVPDSTTVVKPGINIRQSSTGIGAPSVPLGQLTVMDSPAGSGKPVPSLTKVRSA